MENLTLIPTERLNSFQADLNEIKNLLQQKEKQSDFNKWHSKKEAHIKLKVCLKTLDNYLLKGILPYSWINRSDVCQSNRNDCATHIGLSCATCTGASCASQTGASCATESGIKSATIDHR